MGDELAAFETTLPERFRYAVMSALRQTLRAGVAYGYLTASPVTWKNPQPTPRGIRVYTDAEVKKLARELGKTYGPMIRFAAATGLRPDEWARLERRDVDKRRRVLSVRGTKTARSRREVPLTRAALEAVDALPARIDTPHLFANTDGRPLNLNGFRRREWGQRSTLRVWRSRHVCTAFARRSPRTRSHTASPCTSSPGSWAHP